MALQSFGEPHRCLFMCLSTLESRPKGMTGSNYEGCLSLAGFSAVVPRAPSVRVEYLDERGELRSVEATGWYARIVQHEIDHLDGTLYIDRTHSRTFTSLDNWTKFWKAKPGQAG